MLPAPTPVSIPPPPGGPRPGRWWIPIALVAGALWVAYQVRGILTPFLLAFLLAYALDPIVGLLERIRVPRPLGALAVFAGMAAAAFSALGGVMRFLSDDVLELAREVPDKLAALEKRAEPWVFQQFHFRFPHSAKELFARYGDKIREQTPAALKFAQEGVFGTFSALSVLLSLLIVPLFAFYLLIDFDRIVERGGKLVPRRWQRPVFDAMGEIHHMLGGYVRGQLLAMIVLATLYSAGLEWTGLRLAIPIGVFTGFFAFVPYIGFASGLFVALAMAVLEWHGAMSLLHVAGVMLGVQVLDGLMVTPRVVGRSVGLSPVEVLLAMAASGTAFGFLGVLLAVPIGATVKIVLIRLTHAYKQTEFYQQLE